MMRDIYPSFITNGKSILFELVFWLVILSYSGFSISLSYIQIGYWILPLTLPFILYIGYKYTKVSESFSKESSFVPSEIELFSVSVLWVFCAGIFLYKTNVSTYTIASIPLLVSSLYIYRLHLLKKLYISDILFYTDRYSRNESEWVEGGVVLSRSVRLRREGSVFSIFWAILSIGRYKRVYESIDANRDEYDLQGAEDYVFAAKQNLKLCIKEILNSPVKENRYLFNTSIHRAEDKLGLSRCDSCGSVYNKEDMTRIVSDEGVEEKILCSDCDSEYIDVECPHCGRTIKKSERIKQYCIYCEPLNQYNTSSRRTTSQKYRSSYKEYSQKGSSDSSELDPAKNVEIAMSILGINEPLRRDKIIKSYRQRTKQAHPDTDSGSQEKFKKVREARDTLLEELNTK